MKPGFHCTELNHTVWEVPERYTDLVPVGAGAFGQVCSALDLQYRQAFKIYLYHGYNYTSGIARFLVSTRFYLVNTNPLGKGDSCSL